MLTTIPQRTMATSYNPILIPPGNSHNFQMYHLRLYIFPFTHTHTHTHTHCVFGGAKEQTNSLYKSVY